MIIGGFVLNSLNFYSMFDMGSVPEERYYFPPSEVELMHGLIWMTEKRTGSGEFGLLSRVSSYLTSLLAV